MDYHLSMTAVRQGLRPEEISAASQLLLQARREGCRVGLLSKRYPSLDLASAYAIAARTIEAMGDIPIGYKLGYTSAAMQRQMSVSEPNWGVLTADMRLEGDGFGNNMALVHPRVEPEIALIIGRTVKGGDADHMVALKAAIKSVHLALEIVDTRYSGYHFTLEDNTADNSSAAAFVLGPGHQSSVLDSLVEAVTLSEDEQELGRGHADDAMGGPLHALQWLIKTLAAQGQDIPSGAIILTGGLTAAANIHPGRRYCARHKELGEVCFGWVG